MDIKINNVVLVTLQKKYGIRMLRELEIFIIIAHLLENYKQVGVPDIRAHTKHKYSMIRKVVYKLANDPQPNSAISLKLIGRKVSEDHGYRKVLFLTKKGIRLKEYLEKIQL